MRAASVLAIDDRLLQCTLSSRQLASEPPVRFIEKMHAKTEIVEPHTAAKTERSSDLAVQSATTLFGSGLCEPRDVNYIQSCAQSLSDFSPMTECVVQSYLDIPRHAGVLDDTLSCSGVVVGLGLHKGLIETIKTAKEMLLIGAIYSKAVHNRNKAFERCLVTLLHLKLCLRQKRSTGWDNTTALCEI
jgi:3-oxoacyl-[acyl-carrier-protein] synthase III